MRAYVFPGQGAQTIGMGRALADAYPAARAVFEEVDEALGEKLSAVIWDGDIETLTLTRNAQPALMATSIAAMRALEAEGFAITDAAYVAGHSLGEYSALVASGVLTLSQVARLIERTPVEISGGSSPIRRAVCVIPIRGERRLRSTSTPSAFSGEM